MFSLLLLIQALLIIFLSGILYGFSDFIMKALNNISSKSAIDAMNSINVSVYTSLFIVLFMLLPISSLFLAVASVIVYGWSDSMIVVLAGAMYIAGMFMVTGKGNVPLNESLKLSASGTGNLDSTWRNYFVRWTRLNTIRCAFGVLSAVMFIVAESMFAVQ